MNKVTTVFRSPATTVGSVKLGNGNRSQRHGGNKSRKHDHTQRETIVRHASCVDEWMHFVAHPCLQRTVHTAAEEAHDRSGQMDRTHVHLLKVAHNCEAETGNEADDQRSVVNFENFGTFQRKMVSIVLFDLFVSNVDGEREQKGRQVDELRKNA